MASRFSSSSGVSCLLARAHPKAAARTIFTAVPASFRAMSSHQPRFSKGSDESKLTEALWTLLSPSSAPGSQGKWALSRDGEALERSFKFKNFAKTWDFMTAVSLQCKLKNHHPEWSNVYNTTFIRWTTHNPQGLSEKDVTLAGICDALAHDFGEIIEALTTEPAKVDSQGASSCAMGNLANSATAAAGNCCGQK